MTTDLCPCQKAASDMREAAAKVARNKHPPPCGCLFCATGYVVALYIDAIPLQPCTCSPGIVAAAREWLKSIRVMLNNPDSPFAESEQFRTRGDLIRAVEEEDHD